MVLAVSVNNEQQAAALYESSSSRRACTGLDNQQETLPKQGNEEYSSFPRKLEVAVGMEHRYSVRKAMITLPV